MFIFDTNFLIYYFLGRPEIIEFVENNKDGVFYIPAIVITEFLSYPMLDEKTEGLFRLFLNDLIIVNLDREMAELAGELRKENKMKTIDAVIAASAILTNTTLLTYNLTDFKKIRELKVIAP